jgi:hypothetical protein
VYAIRFAIVALGLGVIAGCASHSSYRARRDDTAPGPAGDPWGPYIHEAATRFSVPEEWVRGVMRQESGGHEYINGRPTTSSAGAMGLMQVMPGTYAELARQYGLGSDPYDPHDNIMAGTAYIREMYDKYGSPGFLAAYNAGPARVDSYLAGSSNLPDETVNYVAAIAPRLGNGRPMNGPLSMFAQNNSQGGAAPVSAPPAAQYAASGPIVDPNSFVPVYVVPVDDETQAPASTPVSQPAPMQMAEATPFAGTRSSLGEAAIAPPITPQYQPQPSAPLPSTSRYASRAKAPIGEAPVRTVGFRFVPVTPSGQLLPPGSLPAHVLTPAQARSTQAAVLQTVAGGSGDYAIQVGAFATPMLARAAGDAARARASGTMPAVATTSLSAVSKPGGGALFRARVTHLSSEAAEASCRTLRASRAACIVLPPERAS